MSHVPLLSAEDQRLEDARLGAKLGLVVSKRVGNAVVRNQVKRWIRETFRLRAQGLKKVQLVVIARSNSARSTWLEIDRSMQVWTEMVFEQDKKAGQT